MKKIVYALIAGVVITLIAGFISNPPSGLEGVTRYGYPLVWRVVPVILDATAHYDVVSFIGDVIFWFVVCGVLIYLWTKLKS